MSRLLIAVLIAFISAVLALDPAVLSPVLHHQQIVAAALAVPAVTAEPLARASYYKLKGLGRGPREMHLAGNLIRISAEAAAAWRKERENPKADEAKELARLAERRQQRSRKAAKTAIDSPEHPAHRRRV